VASLQLGDGRGDPLRPAVKERRDGNHLDLPSPPARDRLDVEGERSAADDGAAHPGNASLSMNRSLKSGRPESSTYSTSRTIDSASARSRSDSAAIFAPSPATFPAETIRGSASA